MKKTSYKLWVTIEKWEVDTETGLETYTDIEEPITSAGHVDTLEEASERLEEIYATFGGDFRTE